MVETLLKIVIFLKILDGDLTKITKMSRKLNGLEVLPDKLWFSASERLGSSTRGNSEQEWKNDDFSFENHPDRSKSWKWTVFLTNRLAFMVDPSEFGIYLNNFGRGCLSILNCYMKITVLDTVLNSLAKRLSKKANGLWRWSCSILNTVFHSTRRAMVE